MSKRHKQPIYLSVTEAADMLETPLACLTFLQLCYQIPEPIRCKITGRDLWRTRELKAWREDLLASKEAATKIGTDVNHLFDMLESGHIFTPVILRNKYTQRLFIGWPDLELEEWIPDSANLQESIPLIQGLASR